MGDSRKRVGDLAVTCANSVEGLSSVERHEAVYLPAVSKNLRAVRRTRDVPSQRGREVVAGVEVSITVIQLDVCAVKRKGAPVCGNFVQGVGPGICKLCAQSMPCPEPQGALQGVVVGGSDAVELIDAPVIRKLRCILTELVEVQHDRKLAALASHVSNLPHGHAVSETLLYVKVVIVEVRCPEVLADGENVESRPAAVRVGGHVAGHAGRDTWIEVAIWHPTPSPQAVSRHCGRTRWIVLQTVRSVWRTEVQEWVHIDLVIEHADAAAHDQVFPAGGLIGETEPWSKIVFVGRED